MENKKTEEASWFDRLKLERDNLMEKHIGLTKFLATANKDELKIPEDEWQLLRLQEMVMKEYGYILELRINKIIKRLKNDNIS